MTKRVRRNHNPAFTAPVFKAKVALAAIKGGKALAELAQLYDVRPSRITVWKVHLLGGAAGAFGSGGMAKRAAPTVDLKTLHAKIGELTLESDFVWCALQGRLAERKAMIDRDHELPPRWQAGGHTVNLCGCGRADIRGLGWAR